MRNGSPERERLSPTLLKEMRTTLHDLCQPLTALQCRLYIGTMEDEIPALKNAIDESLVECERMMNKVRTLQERIEQLGEDDGDQP